MGRTLDVLINAPAPEGKNTWLGRTYTDSPDVDGNTWVKGSHLKPGDLVECEIVGAEEHDLIARPVSTLPPKRRTARPRPRRPATESRLWQSLMACRRLAFPPECRPSRLCEPFCRPSESGFSP